VQWDAEKIHSDVAEDSKKLKNAELLVGGTSFLLKHILDKAS